MFYIIVTLARAFYMQVIRLFQNSSLYSVDKDRLLLGALGMLFRKLERKMTLPLLIYHSENGIETCAH